PPHLSSLLYTFFSMCRRPPPATFFPYTTLFRSKRRVSFWLFRLYRNQRTIRNPCLNKNHLEKLMTFLRLCNRTRRSILHIHVLIDRKSTRLNSSHVSISYAVFCLKKKSSYSNKS